MKKFIQTTALALALVLCLLAAGCGGGQAGGDGNTIRVASKDFTENLIIAEVYALALEDAGYTVERTFDINGSIAHTAIVNDEFDLYPEYTGTGLISVLKHDPVTDPDEVYRIISEGYAEQFDLVWLEPTTANDGQGIIVSKRVSDEYGITTISDLQKHAPELRFASQGEFELREDGLPGLEAVYGPFDFKSIEVFSNSLKFDLLINDEVDAAPAYTTEGRLAQPDFVLLEDDKQAWPPYHITPVIRRDCLDAHPEVADILNAVGKTLDNETVIALNSAVDVDMREYEDVAAEYYESIKDQMPG